MTEPTPEPSLYDEIQDTYISALQEIVTPSYTPPGDVEYSFPVVGEGINSQQYQQTNLATGAGILHRFPETYYLDTHATAAETNQRNSLLLKVTRNNEPNAVAEATIHGYFHRMTQDMELPMPPVLTPTDVYVTLTYDPREEESETGPISVQTHNGSLPTTHGREHIIIAKPEMRPNQLLSNTPLNRQRQYSSPVVYVPNATTIPDPSDFLYGTTLVMGTRGRGRILHNSSSSGGWVDLFVGEWEDIPGYGGWNYGRRSVRQRLGGVDIVIQASRDSGSTANSHRIGALPEGYRPNATVHVQYSTSRSPYVRTLVIGSDGVLSFYGGDIDGGWVEINAFIPDHYYEYA